MRSILVFKTGRHGRIIQWSNMLYTEPEPDENGVMPMDFERQEIIPDGAVKVTLPSEECERFFAYNGRRHVVIDGVVTFDGTLTEYRGALELEAELCAIRAEMAANDYKQMKYLRGELPQDEWQQVVAWYTERSAAVNALETELRAVYEEEGAE